MSIHSPATASSGRPPRGLLVISDMHLGSDIGDSQSPPPPARSESVDDDLCALLDHYRETRVDGEPWHLVINGDFIDFIGIALDASTPLLSTEPTEEERAHGLGTAEDHACVKLARVARRHRDVFSSLARFVDAGHQLVIVPGNHDREFHWERVRADFRALLFRASPAAAGTKESEAAFFGRVRFSSWFHWIEGVAYIEHGHQYDTFCSTEHVIAPHSPLDPRRLLPGFSDVLLRFVVHPTAGIRQCDHDRMGMVDYVTLAARLGLRGGVSLLRRYVSAIVELFRLRRVSLGDAARALRAEHERRISHFAETMRIDLHRLHALVELQARPVTRTVRGIMASLLLDELALALLSVSVLSVLEVLGFRVHHFFFAWATAVVLPAWWLIHRYLRSTRHVDPRHELAARAAPLAKLFPAAFVVMGHTHVPACAVIDEGGATYVNTGSWSEDEGAHPAATFAHRAARTHLVIRVRDTGPEAELLAWGANGPTRFVSG